MSEELRKPPLGLMPRWLHVKMRITDILEAIARYAEVAKEVPPEWLRELDDLTRFK
jgi:hypothetical protein